MADSPEPQAISEPRVHIEYEDPHFHDEDDVVPPVDDDVPHEMHAVSAKKPERHLPPPRRRFIDD